MPRNSLDPIRLVARRAAGRLIGLGLIGAVAAACATEIDPAKGRIKVQYTENQPILADRRANQFCADRGQVAVLIQELPRGSDILAKFQRERIYECADPPPQP